MSDSPQIDPPPRLLARISDFWAYIIPMAIFLGFVAIGGQWPGTYAVCYVLRALLVPIALIILWPKYTKIRWNFWWLGIIVGVVGIVQWVGMQLLLEHFGWFKPSADVFNPLDYFKETPQLLWPFIAIRVASAVLIVPVMEELFWRDFVWREILAPYDFKLAAVGEWDWSAFIGVALVFATVHGNWWPTAIVWGLMIGALLAYTRSLGACILMHATTNLFLAAYVLHTHDWSFW